MSMIPGFVTPEGTARLAARFPQLPGFFRSPQSVPGTEGLLLPSMGLGTYLGEPSVAGDAAYTEAIELALRSGINLLDSAINYRHQRSERNLGSALAKLISAGELHRDEVMVCSKAGYLAFDG